MELSAHIRQDAVLLRDRLAELELELATLDQELAAFQADYMRQVGTVMAQVHDLQARIAAIVAERSGAAADARAADAAQAQARRTTAEVRAIPEPPGPPPTEDLKRLFRDAAKRIHPDRFAGDEAAHAHAEAFMKRLNAAYREGDAEAIISLMRQWDSSPLGSPPDDPGRLSREISALRVAVARAEERLQQMRASQLADLLERVMASGGDLMTEMRRDAHAALAAAQARLAALEAS